ncbi:hypothetical protein [Nocardioides ferulae]|uniref:hypothetical protein n=1 Tax=Nocardioides ferulae TaxID=2340821 RepID=UPI000EAE0AC4|nr:hypothetical protein [Nocardioides ferulae]
MSIVFAVPPAESAVVWWLLLSALLVLLLGAALRPPARDAFSVVVRGGRVVRVTGGWVVRVPGLEEVVEWPGGQVVLGVVVRGDTADGVEVRAAVEAVVTVPPPQPRARYADPVRSAERAAERALTEALRGRPVTGLLEPDDGLEAALLRGGLGSAGQLHSVEVLELEVLLSPGADQLGRTRAAHGPR